MFQLQRSLGSTEGLPSLVATAHSSPLSSLSLFCLAVRSNCSSLSVFWCVLCLQITHLPQVRCSCPLLLSPLF